MTQEVKSGLVKVVDSSAKTTDKFRSEKDKEISERNAMLVRFIAGLDLGIHITEFPEKMKFISPDYKYWLHGYVKNYKIILMSAEFGDEKDIFLEVRVDKNPDEYRERFMEWFVKFEHKRIYTLTYGDLFLTGFNHHNKLDHKNPYPVFAKFSPIMYYDLERAIDTQHRFSEYDMKLH